MIRSAMLQSIAQPYHNQTLHCTRGSAYRRRRQEDRGDSRAQSCACGCEGRSGKKRQREDAERGNDTKASG